jgi:hypothetical protein
MPNTAHEIYTQIIQTLPLTERLRLANLILNDLAQHDVVFMDKSDTWSEEDLVDVTNFSLQYTLTLFPEDEEIA